MVTHVDIEDEDTAEIDALYAESDTLLDELKREMEENEKTLAELQPRISEQAGLEEELAALRQQRQKFDLVQELESVKHALATDNKKGGEALKVLSFQVGKEVNASAEAELIEMGELEKELDEEMGRLKDQLEMAQKTSSDMAKAKADLLNELNDFSWME